MQNPSSEQPLDIEHARRLLSEISSRESGQGITVGVLLLKKTYAGEFKKQFLTKHGRKVGYKRVKTISALDPYIVVHLSSRSASDVQYTRLADHGDTTSDIPCDFYSGVRMADPVFGFPELSFVAPSSICDKRDEASYPFSFAEVFAGIGGFRLGLEGQRGLGGRCSFACEVDEAARDTYELNFGSSSALLGDVTDLYASQFPDHDLLTGGFPCQSFSDRGDKRGLDDPRGQLYTELVRILTCKQPRAFLFENVASLVTMCGGKRNRVGESEQEGLVVGRTFATILTALEGCGYNVSHHMVDARHFLPQHRERVYIAGFRRDLGVNGGLGWPEAEASLLHQAGSTTAACDAVDRSDPVVVSASPSTVRDILETEPDPRLSLTPAQWTRVQEAQRKDEQRVSAGQQGWRRLGGQARSREIHLDGKAPTLISGYRNAASVSTRFVFETRDGTALPLPRFLSPRECCRLMGFPEAPHFVLPPEDEAGGQRINRFYKQIGNAVCPPVVRALGALVLQRLREAEESAVDS